MTDFTGIRYILWDMDGTLVDSEPQHYRAWKRTMKRLYGLPDVDFEVYKDCIGATAPRLIRIMKDAYGIELDERTAWPEHEKDIEDIKREEGHCPMPGVHEVVRELKARGLHMAVASSSPEDYLHRVLEAIGLADCFEACVSGVDCAHSKPAPDVFLKTMEAIGAVPEETLVVEDSANGVRAGIAAGCRVIGIDNPGSGSQDISPADCIVRDLREIPALLRQE